MSATGMHPRLDVPSRSGAREALVLAAVLLVGATVGIAADRIISGRDASNPGSEVTMVLPATGWATSGSALREQVSSTMNAVLARQAAAEWATAGAELRERVNRAMNALRGAEENA